MRQIVLVTLLALALPMAAFATSSVDYTNVGGTLTGTSSGLSLTGSAVVAFVNAAGVTKTGTLGTLSFSTGALTGDLAKGGTFAAGGSFTITGNGVPSFTGTFSSPVSWTLMTLPNGTHNYVLSGVVTGTLGGFSTAASTIQITFNTGHGFFNGSTSIPVSGDTNIVVPEPGTLGLLGTGLVGIAGLVRRKLKVG